MLGTVRTDIASRQVTVNLTRVRVSEQIPVWGGGAERKEKREKVNGDKQQ